MKRDNNSISAGINNSGYGDTETSDWEKRTREDENLFIQEIVKKEGR